jgi:TetR/AcrR family transcriptional regulator, transcriptional repressor for nem operon
MTERAQRRAETHERIVEAAGLLFREHGVDGVGVDAIMREAGLTHGGFYAHFPSKEALAAEVARSLLQKAAARWDHISRSRDRDDALRRIVEGYLNPAHLASSAACPLTTLSTDVARRTASRGAMAEPLRGMVDALDRCLPGRAEALAGLATMVGGVVLARLADDPALAAEFLAAAEAKVLAQAGPGGAGHATGA